jgi:hypothetical protein
MDPKAKIFVPQKKMVSSTMDPKAKIFVPQKDMEPSQLAEREFRQREKATKTAFNKSILEQQRKSLDKFHSMYNADPDIKDSELQELISHEESMNRLENNDPTDALLSLEGEREFRNKEPYTRKAFYGMGGKKRKRKTKKNKKKTKSKRGKKSKSRSMRKRK